MKTLKVLAIIVVSFLALIGLVSIAVIKSCSSIVTEVVDQAFDIQQTETLKDGVYYLQVPLIAKDSYVESSSKAMQSTCIDITHAVSHNGPDNGQTCINGNCRFYFKNSVPGSFEYLTKDGNGQCTVINTFHVNPSEIKKRYEINLLVPDAVRNSKSAIELKSTSFSQFESSGHLSIGSRAKVELEYSRPVQEDQLLINGHLFKISVTP